MTIATPSLTAPGAYSARPWNVTDDKTTLYSGHVVILVALYWECLTYTQVSQAGLLHSFH
jgi:hypothetical protein